MRIVIHIPHLRVCGGVRYLLNVASGLQARGHEVAVAPRRFLSDGAPWFKGELNLMRESPRGADLYVTYNDFPPLLPRERPRILMLLGAPEREIGEWDGILTCGLHLMEMAQAHGPAKCVFPGVEPEFQPGRPIMEPIVGVLAHEKSEKNTQAVVEAMGEVRAAIPEALLLAYGKGDFEMDKMLERPSLEEIAALYQRCAVWVMPAKCEGFGMPSLEAAACGAVPIALEYETPLNFPQHNETGIVCKPEALVGEIISLLRDHDRRLVLRERAIAAAREHTWDRVVDEIEPFFEEVIANAR